MSDILLAIDGNSLMHRAYWALPHMNDKKGRPTNAVYGFLTMLFRMVEDYDPSHITVAFDMKEETFRHKQYKDYKAGRRKTPHDLNEQFVMLKDVLQMIGIGYMEVPLYEADDILGSLSTQWDLPTYIFTSDRDELQLISDTTKVVLTIKGVTETKLMDKKALKEDMGVTPGQVIEMKGLMGDASDNIPGVKGVGEKTALKLLKEYDTMDNLYAHIDELPKSKMKENLIAEKDIAYMSRDLGTIYTEMELENTPADFEFDGFDNEKLGKMFKKYNFKNFMKRFGIEREEEKAVEQVVIDINQLSMLEDALEFAFIWDDEGFKFSLEGKKEYLLPLKQNLLEEGYDYQELLDAVRPYFAGRRAIGHDIKKCMHEFADYEIEITDFFDVMLAAWVLSPSHANYDLERILRRAGLQHNAAHVYKLHKKQIDELAKNNLEFIYFDMEEPLLRVLFAMEQDGFFADRAELVRLGKEYDGKIKSLTDTIYELAGEEFNINSPKQLSEVLFETLKLPVIKKTKTGYSTDAEVLETLESEHEIIGYIMEYRSLSKLKGTYVDGLIDLIKDGYIHTTFLQTATATGRLSSIEPNLQNIPIRSALANEIRAAFAAPEGTTIVSADYSQIELRILAHIADDADMKQTFMDGEDIHTRTAAEILGKDIADVTPADRSHAKAVNFGIVYGISDYGLARDTGLSRKEAGRYIRRYLERFEGVKKYMDDIKASAHEDGHVRTMFNRIRYIPEINSGNFNIRSAGERAALNTPIQGTAADIMKIAMIRVAKELEKTNSRLVLQVHDELIVYAAEGEEEQVKAILKDCMEHAAELSVPLVVDVASGKTWLEAK